MHGPPLPEGEGDAQPISWIRRRGRRTGCGGQVQDVTAQSDGKVVVKLDTTGSDFKDQTMVALVANAVLNKVPEVKQLTLTWSSGARIGVYTAK